MMIYSFRRWVESKGIRVPDDLDAKIEAIIPKLLEVAKRVKQTGQGEDLEEEIEFENQYKKRSGNIMNHSIHISVVNDPDLNADGEYNLFTGVTVNVAHVQEVTDRWLRRLLIHEIGVHAQDPKLNTVGLPPPRSGGTGGKEYYNSPQEFDAYSGQIVWAVIKMAKSSKGTEREPMVRQSIQDGLEYLKNPTAAAAANKYGYVGDPDYWRIYHTYKQSASPTDWKRFIGRLANASQEALEILGPGPSGIRLNL